MPDPDPLLEDDLDAFLDIDIPTSAPDDDDPDIDTVLPAIDVDMAERIAYKARRLEKERCDVRVLANKRRAAIDAWEADRGGGIEREIARAERSLELFARQWHRANPRSKTLSLPSGTLRLRAGRGKIEVDDEVAFVQWCESHSRHDLLRYEPKPKKADLTEIDRHEGIQRNAKDGTLVQTWKIMAEVITVDGDGELTTEKVSIPGVVYTEPVVDKFTFDYADQPQEEA